MLSFSCIKSYWRGGGRENEDVVTVAEVDWKMKLWRFGGRVTGEGLEMDEGLRLAGLEQRPTLEESLVLQWRRDLKVVHVHPY